MNPEYKPPPLVNTCSLFITNDGQVFVDNYILGDGMFDDKIVFHARYLDYKELHYRFGIVESHLLQGEPGSEAIPEYIWFPKKAEWLKQVEAIVKQTDDYVLIEAPIKDYYVLSFCWGQPLHEIVKQLGV